MSKLQDMVTRSKTFLADVTAEMHRCSWPERQELVESTVVVIVSVVMLSVFVGFSDKVLVLLLKLLVRPG
jgi:preprotein translocase subunit SecE